MKTKIYLLLAAFAVLFVACKDDDGPGISLVDQSFQVRFSDDYDSEPAADVAIQLVNIETSTNTNLETDENGYAMASLLPGTYSVNASLTMTPEQYFEFSGQTVEQDVAFNASLSSVTINSASSTTTELILSAAQIGNLVMSQIYFAGSDVRQGAVFRDQFVQIHNNSNTTIYLDGLCFAQLKGESRVSSNLDPWNLPNGQYDWSQSIGQTKGDKSNTDYVYVEEIIRIPGNGQTYPLESGQSTIIAATAINHKAPLTYTNDEGESETIEVANPDLTYDLSGAQFEAYFQAWLESIGKSYLDYDVDAPAAINLEIPFKVSGNKDLILDPFGRDAFAIFYANDEQIGSYDQLPLPSITDVDDGTTLFLQVPIDIIVDGVELQNVDTSRPKPKRLPDAIDAGEKAGVKGKYSSEVIKRIEKGRDGDKIFYQDTNNSANDFEVLDRAVLN